MKMSVVLGRKESPIGGGNGTGEGCFEGRRDSFAYFCFVLLAVL